MRILTGDTKANAGNRSASCFRYLGATLGAVTESRSLRQLALRTLDGVLDGCVDLLLYGALTGPTCRHVPLLE